MPYISVGACFRPIGKACENRNDYINKFCVFVFMHRCSFDRLAVSHCNFACFVDNCRSSTESALVYGVSARYVFLLSGIVSICVAVQGILQVGRIKDVPH